MMILLTFFQTAEGAATVDVGEDGSLSNEKKQWEFCILRCTGRSLAGPPLYLYPICAIEAT